MGLLDFLDDESALGARKPRGLLGTSMDDPRTSAVLAAAQGLLAAPRKQNFMLSLTQALNGYQGAMAASQDTALRRALLQSQIGENAAQAKYRDQMIEVERTKLQREKERQEFLSRLVPQPMSPASAALSAGAQAGSVGPTQANAQRMNTMPPQQQALMTPAQAAYAKLMGLGDVTEVAKFYATPHQLQAGSFYERPGSGQREYIPKDGIGMRADGTAFEVPGYGEAQAGIEAQKAEAIKRAEAGYTMVNGYDPRTKAPIMVPLSSVLGGQQPRQAGGPMPSGPNVIPPDVQAGRDSEALRIISGELQQAEVAAARGDQRAAQMVPALRRELQRMGAQGGAPQVAPVGQPGAPFQTGPSASDVARSGYDAEVQKDFAKRRSAIHDAANNARSVIGQYQQLDSLLANPRGGALTEKGMELASMLNTVGIKVDPNLGNKEAAAAIGNKLVLDMNSGSLGAGVSNADVQFLQKTIPTVNTTAEGRRTLVRIAIATEQRKMEIAQAARNYEKRHGALDSGFYDQLQRWSEANPLFGGK